MITVTGVVPKKPSTRPSIVFVHGAANSSGVWTFWQQQVACHGWPSFAADLRGHGRSRDTDLALVSMQDYADDVRTLVTQLRDPRSSLDGVSGGWWP